MADEHAGQPWAAELSPSWDEDFAESLCGAYVLLVLTFLNADGSPEEHIQMHGRVTVADPQRGIAIALEGNRVGETYWLPPGLDGFRPAKPGEYRLRSTGEVIIDPDYTSSWTINRPPKV